MKFKKLFSEIPITITVIVIAALPIFNVIASNYLISKYGKFFSQPFGRFLLITWLIIYTLITLRLLVGAIRFNFTKVNSKNLGQRKFMYEVVSVIVISLLIYIFSEHFQFMEISIVLEDSLIPPFFNHYLDLNHLI
ncbi:hypothetical protein WR164_03060 [Philodulcilactobacillus myokoensis]|uniref:Uncharacterized protein n=1 Tax=Philodulcilactobacillus myokoensis TaxID=2929573 RepID=A0A9W6ESB0_9LACO|nr:hypothetical protein [Philodulcilactobacillus myokoensis]GLB46327.1 hypothetical protein WR164_03060 [Philodulcilactobacillus myokoensis]